MGEGMPLTRFAGWLMVLGMFIQGPVLTVQAQEDRFHDEQGVGPGNSPFQGNCAACHEDNVRDTRENSTPPDEKDPLSSPTVEPDRAYPASPSRGSCGCDQEEMG